MLLGVHLLLQLIILICLLMYAIYSYLGNTKIFINQLAVYLIHIAFILL